jgi:hypothetical protein
MGGTLGKLKLGAVLVLVTKVFQAKGSRDWWVWGSWRDLGVVVEKLPVEGLEGLWCFTVSFLPSHITSWEGMPSGWPAGVKLLKCPKLEHRAEI